MAHQQSDGSAVCRLVAHVELESDADKHAKVERFRELSGSVTTDALAQIEQRILDPAMYKMTVTLTAVLEDGRRVTAGGFTFGGPRRGLGAIWYRYRGPQLSDDPDENERLLNETYHVGLPDIEDAIDQMLGRNPDQHRPPRLSWNHLLDALAEVGIDVAEEDLIALPFEIELSDAVRAEISAE